MQTTLIHDSISAVIKHKGAELFQLSKNNKKYIWTIDEQFWNKTSPVLFPIVGSLKNNTFQFNGENYSLFRHGFARDFNFELIEKTKNEAVFSLKSNAETLKLYPFDFELQLIYSLTEIGLKLEYKVRNLSDYDMPFSIGAHPAFAIEGKFNEYFLEFEHNENITTHHLQNDLFSGKTSEILLENSRLKLDYSLFEKDAIVLKNNTTSYVIVYKNSEPQYKVSFTDFPFLGIWTKKNAPFICIEPWLGIADSEDSTGNIFEKEGIQILEPNKKFSASFSVELF